MISFLATALVTNAPRPAIAEGPNDTFVAKTLVHITAKTKVPWLDKQRIVPVKKVNVAPQVCLQQTVKKGHFFNL